MNTRQKAKYWKLRYLELASVPIPTKFVISDRKVETLKYTTVIDDEIRIRQISDNPALQKMMLDTVKKHLAETAESYVDVVIEHDPLNCKMRINGRLGVARPFHGDPNDILPMYEWEWRSEYDKRRSS